MRGFWLLVHVLGFTLWLGGGIATMIAGVTAKRFAAPTHSPLISASVFSRVGSARVASGDVVDVIGGSRQGRPSGASITQRCGRAAR